MQQAQENFFLLLRSVPKTPHEDGNMTKFVRVDDGINPNMWQDTDGNLYVGRSGQAPEEIVAELERSENPPLPPIIELPSVRLWERLTEKEADDVRQAMATQPFRTQQIFLTANTFRSDHELWSLLVQMATDLFGEARASELLAGD